MTLAAKLDQAIKAVCPIHGVSIGTLEDKATWSVNFKEEASEAQRAAAASVLAAFDLDRARVDLSVLAREAELGMQRWAREVYLASGPDGEFKERVRALERDAARLRR